MDKNTFRRFGWAVYLSIALIAFILILLAAYEFEVGTTHDYLLNFSAELLGVAVIFFFVYQFFRWSPEEEQHKEQERLLNNFKNQLEQTQTELKHVEQLFSNLLTKSLGGKYLKGAEKIYNSALRLYESVEKQIRVLQIASGPQPPPEYAEAAARIMQAKMQDGIVIKFDAVLVLNLEKLPPDFKERNNVRFGIYEKYGVRDWISLFLLDQKHPLGFTIFIVDRKHAHISFTTLAGVKQLESAVEFENQPLIASDLADWYDQIVLRSAISYEDWLQQHS